MTLRIVVHDFAGHPFQLDLSRELSRRGHDVLHVYSEAFESPKANLDSSNEQHGLQIKPADLGLTFDKQDPFKRAYHEYRYGRRLASLISIFNADIVLSSNSPLLSQYQLISETRPHRLVHWWQDIQSIAAEDRFGGTPLAFAVPLLKMIERRVVRSAAATIGIAEIFRDVAIDWGGTPERIHVIPNWAPIKDLPQRPRRNSWSRRHGLDQRPTVLYSGTLGMKHNPELLAALAEHLGDRANIVVVSQGLGADYLRDEVEKRDLSSLQVLPFQSFDELPDVFGSADILVAILEPSAGAFSVPSKVLSYLCAARPLLLAVPPTNLSARIVEGAKAGVVVDPQDHRAFVAAAERLISSESLRKSMGSSARQYAEDTFDVSRITDRFESIFQQVVGT